MTALTTSDLAAFAGCEESTLAMLVDLGLIGGGGHTFSDGDINRVRLALALHSAGIALPSLASAVAAGELSLDFAGQLMFEPVHLTRQQPAETLQALSLPATVSRRLRAAMGLSELDTAQALRQDDLELMQLIGAARAAGLSDDSLARVLRVFGQSVRRTVEAMRELFRSQVEEPALAAGLSAGAMLSATADQRLKLQRVGFRALFLLQRRLLEDAVFDNVVTRVQEVLLERGGEAAMGRAAQTVLFADLVGYTAFTHAMGDAAAVEQAATFEALAYETAHDAGGHFIKALGDGVMMVFPTARSAVDAGFELGSQARALSLPPLRIGLATGPVVPRDGDIFGRTVNLAARIVAEAREGEVLACEATIEWIGPQFTAKARPTATLKGFSAAPALYALTSVSARGDDGGR